MNSDLPTSPPFPRKPTLLAEAVTWERDLILRNGFTTCRILEVFEKTGEVLLEHVEEHEQRQCDIKDLELLISQGALKVLGKASTQAEWLALITRDDREHDLMLSLPLAGRSQAEVARTLIRVRWVAVLKAQKMSWHKIEPLEMREFAAREELPHFEPDTLFKWCELERRGPEHLIPNYRLRGGAGSYRVQPAAEALLANAILRAKDGKLDLSVDAVQSALEADIVLAAQENPPRVIKPISRSTINRRFNQEVSQYERQVRRLGKERADKFFRPTTRRPVSNFPGGISEFDDVDTKVFCIDERTGLGWGRPWITHGVDQDSRYPVGASMDSRPRSAESAIRALIHSIEAKDLKKEGLDDMGVEWLALGFPALCLFDNATYNKERFLAMNVEAGDISWSRAYTPTDKREIEYLNGRARVFFDTLPGRKPMDGDPSALAEGLSTAVFGLADFRLRFLRWLISSYAQTPSEDGLTAHQRYDEDGRIKLRNRVPPDMRRLRLLRCIPLDAEPRVWGPGGLRTMGLTFHNPEVFPRWVRTGGMSRKVYVRVDPDDLTFIYVQIPQTDHYLVLRCLDSDYVAGVTLYQHKAILSMARELKFSNPSMPQLWLARQKLVELTKEKLRSSKVSVRRSAYRVDELAAPKVNVVTDVEAAYDELNEVVLATGDEGWTLPSFF